MATKTDFTIIKGKQLDFNIIVKENNNVIPLVLNSTDTFTFSLVDKKTGIKFITDKPMVITDALNGEVSGTITSAESSSLLAKKARAEDKYIPRSNLRLVVSGNTISQGEMVAYIEDVYVIEG